MQRLSSRRIPQDFNYQKIEGLNREIREKLSRVQPLNLAMASRIPGITPAAISILNVQIEMARSRRSNSSESANGNKEEKPS
jgi:tRNA uridine 5-carboxymethylaminomethyl modification enzyme